MNYSLRNLWILDAIRVRNYVFFNQCFVVIWSFCIIHLTYQPKGGNNLKVIKLEWNLHRKRVPLNAKSRKMPLYLLNDPNDWSPGCFSGLPRSTSLSTAGGRWLCGVWEPHVVFIWSGSWPQRLDHQGQSLRVSSRKFSFFGFLRCWVTAHTVPTGCCSSAATLTQLWRLLSWRCMMFLHLCQWLLLDPSEWSSGWVTDSVT